MQKGLESWDRMTKVGILPKMRFFSVVWSKKSYESDMRENSNICIMYDNSHEMNMKWKYF